jgi:hypothetical protein
MAITIAGSGIVEANLADNAVTAVKIADNAVDLAEMATGTDGELITYDTLGDPAKVAVGTSGHVLTSGGVGVAPTFQAAAGGGGKVLQVIQDTKTDTWSTTGGGTITGLSVAITPSLTTSKILIYAFLNIGASSNIRHGISLQAGGSTIFKGDTAGSRSTVTAFSKETDNETASNQTIVYLHSANSVSEQTYTIYGKPESGTMYCNREHNDYNAATDHRGASSIVVMEIGA